jgi:hypothetical protein
MEAGQQTMKYLPWILAIIAVWLMTAPSVLGYAKTEPAMHNDVGVGVVLLLASFLWGLSELRRHGFSRELRAQIETESAQEPAWFQANSLTHLRIGTATESDRDQGHSDVRTVGRQREAATAGRYT